MPLPLGPHVVAASQKVGPLFPLITPSPAPVASSGIASAFPVITPSPTATSSAGPLGQVRTVSTDREEGLALSEPLAGSRQAGVVLLLLAVAGAAGLLLGRARKRRAPFTPSPVPATSPGIGRETPGSSPAAAPVSGRRRPGAPGQGPAPGELLPGSSQARLILTLLAVAGATGWLLLGRARKRRVP